VSIDFVARPGPGAASKVLRGGQLAEVEFRITEEATGNPLRSNVPGAWLQAQEGATCASSP
jgi:hypothetical protein